MLRDAVTRPHRVKILGAATVLLGTLGGSLSQVAVPDGREGEGGLRVAIGEERLEARWITRDSVPGRLELMVGDSLARRVETDPGFAHVVTVPLPSVRTFTLRYGAPGQGLHETLIDLSQPRPAPVRVPGVDSLFIVGDTHGELDTLRAVLHNSGIVDAAGSWSGGSAHVVFLGDFMDRGRDVTRLLWFVYRLEREARDAGGAVHSLLGNHELMVLMGDLRYVHPAELWTARSHGVPYARWFDLQETVLGRWIASKPGMMKIGDVLLAHGGVSADYVEDTLESHRDSLVAFMHEDLFRDWSDTTVVVVADSSLLEPVLERPGVSDAIVLDSAAYDRRIEFFWGDRSVFWYRGYTQSDSLDAELDTVLAHFGVDAHAVAHTPDPIGAHWRYGDRVVATHAPTPAAQLVLLVREGSGYAGSRIGTTGPPQPLPRPHP